MLSVRRDAPFSKRPLHDVKLTAHTMTKISILYLNCRYWYVNE